MRPQAQRVSTAPALGSAQVPGSDGELRPKLSPLAALARRDKLRTSKGSKDVNTYSVNTPANASAILAVHSPGNHHRGRNQQEERVVSWSSIIQRYVSHIYCGASDQEIRDGVAKDNPDPFPLAQVCSVQTVDDNDRRIALRGRKKVVADRPIAADQVIGIYEGEVLFEEEQHRTTNVMNRLSKEWKTFEYEAMEKASYRIAISDAQNLEITGDVLHGTAIRYRNPLLVDGDKTIGAFAWATELNDFRADPLNPFADGDPSNEPNITYIEVTIMNWPCIFIVANQDIWPGVELTLDYGSYWDGFRGIYRDQQVVQRTIADIVKPLVEHLDAIGDSVQYMFEKQSQLERDLFTLKKRLNNGNKNKEQAHHREVESQFDCVVKTMRSRIQNYTDFLEPLSHATQEAPHASRLQSNIFGLACDEERRARWTKNLKEAAGLLDDSVAQMSEEARKSGSKGVSKTASNGKKTAAPSDIIIDLMHVPIHSRNTRAARHARAQLSVSSSPPADDGSSSAKRKIHSPAPSEEEPASTDEPAASILLSSSKSATASLSSPPPHLEQLSPLSGKGVSRKTHSSTKRSKTSEASPAEATAILDSCGRSNYDVASTICSDLGRHVSPRPLKKPKLEHSPSLQNVSHTTAPVSSIGDLCRYLLRELVKMPDSGVFWDDVDVEAHPTYPEFVKEPMCLSKIEAGIQSGSYTSLASFVRDVSLIFENCRAFNLPEDDIYKLTEGFDRAFQRDLTLSVVFCPECSGLAFNSTCAECKKTFRRSQLSSVMSFHNIVKRLYDVEKGTAVIARWYQNAIYYKARVVELCSSKPNTFLLDFLDGAKPHEVHVNDLLLHPEPLRDEAAILSKSCKVMARIPSSLSEHGEKDSFQPGIVQSASLHTVGVKFVYGRQSDLRVEMPRSEVIVVDEAFYQRVIKDIADMARQERTGEYPLDGAPQNLQMHDTEPSKVETPSKARLFVVKSATKAGTKQGTSPGILKRSASKSQTTLKSTAVIAADCKTVLFAATASIGKGSASDSNSTINQSTLETTIVNPSTEFSGKKSRLKAWSTPNATTPSSSHTTSAAEALGGAHTSIGTPLPSSRTLAQRMEEHISETKTPLALTPTALEGVIEDLAPVATTPSWSSPIDLSRRLTPAFGAPLPALSDLEVDNITTVMNNGSKSSSSRSSAPIIILDSDSEEPTSNVWRWPEDEKIYIVDD
ncbi:hypothetical protein HDU89_008023 [Geranomyces variabilis]|nr:hypothetical protein HDU89_008023 [Geranomyces variabilis]